ncbi:DeoR/GlpR family DNA-binding transcription regulator [Cohnella nanjingensis]|uniref:DeoR/GlpR transcriptional regulator n=1 Tax=Cohnella nanjingensis TaxID=1387779 RepID=A0A7X0RMX0_9BACL|nr:DeoR/GlpR family DNA-binding transcription regulator [Cohnella nanjingensis]MBB6670473.1 DeoR/GlpR transcriptional regulator [Cohnella nanjingensis]
MSKIVARREGIVALLRERGAIAVADIMDRFGVSEATARRDLETLERDKKLIRTFGGAVLETVRTEIPFYRKMEMNPDEKKEIAEKAYRLIRDGDVIGLTGGTTCMFVARRIVQQPFERLTVVTNALNIGFELAGVPGLELIMTGGVNRTQSYELSGPMADATLERITIQKTFLGADGVDLTRGLTTFNELEANTNRMMIRQSLESYALADHSKLGHCSLFFIDSLLSVTALVTDSGMSAEQKRAYADAGIRFV